MKKYLLILIGILNIYSFVVFAQSKYYKHSNDWLKKSEACKPAFVYKKHFPLRIVKSVKDEKAYQGWRMEDVSNVEILFNESLKKHSGIILDFGEHLTGTFNFSLKILGERIASDAPIRLKFTFAEVPSELNTPFDPYPGGLSRAWLQDEIITLMTVPIEASIPRRLSFRYLKIDVLGASSFDFAFDKMSFTAQSAVEMIEMDLATTTDPLIKKSNESNDEGLLHATVFEEPYPHPQYGQYCLDYALIYNVALLEYVKVTGDKETAEDLWPVVVRQIEMALRQYSPDWIYDMQKPPIYWLVFDWKDNYDRQASMQGLTIWALNKSYELAQLIGKDKEVKEWSLLASKMKKAARRQFYDQKQGVIVSGPSKQVSYLSQAWMILSETLNAKEGVRAMKKTMSMSESCYPGCPYAYHYIMEALLKCGMDNEAKKLLMDYWGGMVKKGADTFWEVYDPNNDKLSPYGFYPMNSYCHAWSCTPVYFINKYPEVFQ